MPKALEIDRPTVQALYIAGVRPIEIARQLGVKVATISTWANRYGWKPILDKTAERLRVANVMGLGVSNQLRDELRAEAVHQVSVLRSRPAKGPRSLANTPQRQGRAAVLKTLTEAVSLIDDWEQEKRSGLVLCDLLSGEPAAIDLQPVAPVAIQDEAAVPAAPADCGIDTPTGSVPGQQAEAEQPQVNDSPSPLSDTPSGNE